MWVCSSIFKVPALKKYLWNHLSDSKSGIRKDKIWAILIQMLICWFRTKAYSFSSLKKKARKVWFHCHCFLLEDSMLTRNTQNENICYNYNLEMKLCYIPTLVLDLRELWKWYNFCFLFSDSLISSLKQTKMKHLGLFFHWRREKNRIRKRGLTNETWNAAPRFMPTAFYFLRNIGKTQLCPMTSYSQLREQSRAGKSAQTLLVAKERCNRVVKASMTHPIAWFTTIYMLYPCYRSPAYTYTGDSAGSPIFAMNFFLPQGKKML